MTGHYIVLHTINGTSFPMFQANMAFGTQYGWDTEDVSQAQTWDSPKLAALVADELNGRVPAGVRAYHGPAALWRVERLEDWT